MKEKSFEITENRMIADNTYEMTLVSLDGNHGVEKPGQFVNIKLDDFFLRRPISICYCRDAYVITVIYKVVGEGTRAMSCYRPGKRLSLLTALGNGFDVCQSGKYPLLIGGGAGIPPMYGLAKQLILQGKKPAVVLGFNSAKEVFYTDEFEDLKADLTVCTADGSFGVEGFVTDALKNLSYTYFYACGPEAMLRALDEHIDKNICGQMSFEERMGCGFGACMGCSCQTKYGSKRICREGPVLERSEIIW